MSRIAALQLPTLSMSEARIDYYLRVLKDKNASLALLGEYVLNSFFTELKEMPRAMINEQISHKKALMSELARKYEITIIAPIILPKKDGFIKTCTIFDPIQTKFYEQNLLINYDHWDERGFFANSCASVKIPIFTHKKLKFGVIFGFEAHFDLFWEQILREKVDVVLVPSASTFSSNGRWEKLLEIRAFLNHCYILRANRVGRAKFSISSEFYGDSFIVGPSGEIDDRLRNEEGILLCDIDKERILNARKTWKFGENLAHLHDLDQNR